MMKRTTKNWLTIGALTLFTAVMLIIALPAHLGARVPLVGHTLASLRLNLGLDLQGGIHLEYAADLSRVTDRNGDGSSADEREKAIAAAQAVIERRVNAFGVGEPVVQRVTAGEEQRIIVELPGLRNIEDAKNIIKETPFLDFREEGEETPEIATLIGEMNTHAQQTAATVLDRAQKGEDFESLARTYSEDPGSAQSGGDLGFVSQGMLVAPFDEALFANTIQDGATIPHLVETEFGWHVIRKDEERMQEQMVMDPLTGKETGEKKSVREIHAHHILFAKKSIADFPELQWHATGLTGAQLKSADFDPGIASRNGGVAEPSVLLHFDQEGAKAFAEITRRMVGKRVAIFLDDTIISAPVIQTQIDNGEAQITGNFTLSQAKDLAGRLNEGALPVAITLVGQQSIDASLGATALHAGIVAGIAGIVFTTIFMIAYYRFFGLVAIGGLVIYTATILALFRLSSLLPGGLAITLTLAGIAGFVLSIGMAVDANILIFERIKEERRKGKTLKTALRIGFDRAWPSIRDGHISTMMTCVILIGMGTGFVKGFAIILFIGVAMSMFTAVVLVRSFLMAGIAERLEGTRWWLGA